MGDARYELLLTEAVRQLDAQLRDLDQLRTRASWLISACAVSTSFLGAGVVRVGSLDGLAGLAIVMFCAALGIALWAMAGPVSRVPAGFSPDAIEREWIEVRGLDEDQIRLNLALQIEQAVKQNEDKLDTRRRGLTISAVMLGLEIVVWLLELA
jgi:hypothetical protein